MREVKSAGKQETPSRNLMARVCYEVTSGPYRGGGSMEHWCGVCACTL